MKRHILIVEDEALLYRRLRNFLEKNHFTVDDYTPDVATAIERIRRRKPDLVLLDINLQGPETGIDLGKRLEKDFRIPFIYVTEADDPATFHFALKTRMEDFMVKTKPVLDKDELLRKILIVLNRYDEQPAVQGILALTDYLSHLREQSYAKLSEVVVPYDNILYFMKDHDIFASHKPRNHVNYTRVVTGDGNNYLIYKSLKQLLPELPYHFVRVNDKYIVNITSPHFKGRINGKRIKFDDHVITISPTYLKEFNKRMNHFYLPPKN
ncbi:MAG: response regulator transcription factor [Chlorobi bacterium]|nr:response regulator transcription factor [Chlorobiota bacterium]